MTIVNIDAHNINIDAHNINIDSASIEQNEQEHWDWVAESGIPLGHSSRS